MYLNNQQGCPLSKYGCEKKNSAEYTFYDLGDFKYGIEDDILDSIVSLEDDEKYLIFCLLKEYHILYNKTPILASSTQENDKSFFIRKEDLLLKAPKLEEIPFRTLRLYVKMSEKLKGYFSQKIFIIESLNYSYTQGEDGYFFSRDVDTIKSTISYLTSLSYIDLEIDNKARTIIVRPEGIAFIKGYIGESRQGFVAMKFGKSPKWADKSGKVHPENERDMDKFYDDCIAKAIEKAGYEPTRIDRVSHNKKIDDEILVQIRKSKFVVCDLTYENLGAYYEAGFAQGLGKEVFFICEKNYFESHAPHFDLNHHVTTLYEIGKEESFIKELAARIENNVVGI